jgi:hypothetical protein
MPQVRGISLFHSLSRTHSCYPRSVSLSVFLHTANVHLYVFVMQRIAPTLATECAAVSSTPPSLTLLRRPRA